MYLKRGQRIKLSDLCKLSYFTIKISTEGNKPLSFDISCVGVDDSGKCPDDRYMIFYNQKKSPCGSINLRDSENDNSITFDINLSKLSPQINKLVFTMTIDGDFIMSDLKQGSLILNENGIQKGGFKFNGTDFKQEKSIIICEIYLKNEWRFSAIGMGFNGGLSALLEHFGIEEENDNNSPIPDSLKTEHPPDTENPSQSKFMGFFKSIFSAPLKRIEQKRNEKIELDEKLEKEYRFQVLLRDYLSDGVLTKEEMESLDSFCRTNGLNLHNCLTKSQSDIERFLHIMLADIVADNIVTSEEEAAINSIFKFLNPPFKIRKEIEETLKRVKLIEKIKSGDVTPINTHSIITKMGEMVWHYEPNVKLVRQLKNELLLPSGDIFITSERIAFKSHDYPTEILLKNIIDLEVKGSNFFITGKNSKSTCRFRLDDSEILKAYVEQAVNKFHRKLNFSQTSGKTRTIPQSVKQAVWLNYNGQCVECTATEYLEYDHIIPFSKGGSNSENNIQLLCRKCNLSKSDKI